MKNKYIFVAISIFLWSTLATTAKFLLGSLNNMQVLYFSSFFSGISLLVFNIVTGKVKNLKEYRMKDFFIIALIGLPGTFLYYVFYYAGAERLPASRAFIINYMWPIMSVVFACIILKEKMTIRKLCAIIISFFGVAVVTSSELLNFSQEILNGALLCLLGAVSYGLFTSLNQKMKYDKCISMMINSFTAFILTGAINALKGDLFVPDFVQLLGLAYNGIFTMAIPNTMWILALESGNTAKISNLAYITPFLSLIWTSIFLKEELTFYSVIGLLIIVAGILIQLNPKNQNSF